VCPLSLLGMSRLVVTRGDDLTTVQLTLLVGYYGSEEVRWTRTDERLIRHRRRFGSFVSSSWGHSMPARFSSFSLSRPRSTRPIDLSIVFQTNVKFQLWIDFDDIRCTGGERF
jgi:hypothetical protein